MAGSEKDQDRTEQATPFKLKEARARGSVAKSMELTAWFILLATVSFFAIFGEAIIGKQIRIAAGLFSQSASIPLSEHAALRLFAATMTQLFSTFSFLAATIVVAGLLINFSQVGPVFSWTPMKADFSRLNPVTGLKKFFNVRILYELLKTSVKLAALVAITVWFIAENLGSILVLLQIDVDYHPGIILREGIKFSFWLLAAFGLLAILDFAFTKWEYAKNMRMSRRELKDEFKRREGDPKVKAKIRELQREAAKRGASLGRIAEADVVITNPTHITVAIQYKRGQMPAPMVIAKGAGELALKMRLKARQCNVPTFENKPLARKLFKKVRIDEPVLPETYAQIAKILTEVFRAKERAGN